MQPLMSQIPRSESRVGGFRRSLGLKFSIVCALALIMTIPSFFVDSLITERSGRASEVLNEVSRRVGGPQNFLGPTLAVPYLVPAIDKVRAAREGVYFVAPVNGTADVSTATETRRVSLFRVPVFRSDVIMNAHFDLAEVPHGVPEGAQLDWTRAEALVGVADTRGALSDGVVTVGGRNETPTVSKLVPVLNFEKGKSEQLTMLAVRLKIAQKPTAFDVAASLRFSGAQRVSLIPFARSTQMNVRGDWASPGFIGSFVPTKQSVSHAGFVAAWNVPSMARAALPEGDISLLASSLPAAVGVNFVEVADPYQSVTRSLKYEPLFLALVFLSYFVFEVTTGKRVHPAQYVLVGIAQTVFFLLLLSLAERTGFNWAFLVAGASTVSLLATNAKWVFVSKREGARALAVFSLLYTLIYVLLRLEDNALLVGAAASFIIVAAVMYFTRSLDWYGTSIKFEAAGAGDVA